MNFNPFTTNFRELTAADLNLLRSVEEGWYVEYKQSMPKSTSIAKSLAAFANHVGGWVFYGVREAKVGAPVADGFPGIPQEELRNALDRLTAAAAR